MNLKAENLITDSLKNKSRYVLKKFECRKCGQTYLYIVKENIDIISCDICATIMNSKGGI